MPTIDTDQLKASVDMRDFTSVLGECEHSNDHDSYICPFHNDDRPSFVVWSNHAHCYGCSWHGDVLNFLTQYYSKSFLEAVEMLGGNIASVPRPAHPQKPTEPKKPSIPMSVVEQNFVHLQEGLSYYEQRRISDDTSILKKLGVKPDFATVYKMKSGEEVWFKAKRYALPNVFAGQVRGINYRRDDEDFLKKFTFHTQVNQVMDDLEEKLGHFPEDTDIIKHCAGPKYRQEKGSVARAFNVQMIAEVKGGKVEKIVRPYILVHAEIKELDTLAMMCLGYPCVGVSLSADLIPSLVGIFQHIPFIFIPMDNDEVGRRKAEALQSILGRGRIIKPPEGKDTGETIAAGSAHKWMDSYGLSPILQGQY